MRLRNNYVLGILLILMSNLIVSGYEAQCSLRVSEENWINLPSSPLESILSSSKRDLILRNRSSKPIMQYKLGCIYREGDKVRFVRKMPAVDTHLEPGEALLNSITIYAADIERCKKTMSKITVVEVRFADGSIWKARR